MGESAPASLRSWCPRAQGVLGIDNTTDYDSETSRLARDSLHSALEHLLVANSWSRYGNEALTEARARFAAREESERCAFTAAVDAWRLGSGPVTIEREEGVVTRPAGSWADHAIGSQSQ